MSQLRVGVIGAGYWGPNLIRNFTACPHTEVTAIADADANRLRTMGERYPRAKLCPSIEELLAVPLDAVAIATPVSTHHRLASLCLNAGLHLLVEKPLAASSLEAEFLVTLAAERGRVLMVDHTYLFSNPILAIKRLLDQGELGDLYYVDSVRINLGLFQHDVNVVWDLAPHDLAILDFLLDTPPQSLTAQGCGHASPAVADMAYVNLDYGRQRMANLHVNWLSPLKIRQMIFAGSRKSLVFNELNATEPIKVYDRGISVGTDPHALRRQMIGYRTGDIWSPNIEPAEALQAMVCHFADSIRHGTAPRSDGRLGLRVVRLLEAANHSLSAHGIRVPLHQGAPYACHA